MFDLRRREFNTLLGRRCGGGAARGPRATAVKTPR